MFEPSSAAVEPSRVQAWLSARGFGVRALLAIVAGATATLGQAPFQIVPAYVVAITALVWLLDVAAAKKNRLRAAAATGFYFALGHFSTGLYWVASAFLVDSATWGPGWGVAADAGMALGLSLFWIVGCIVALLFWTRDVRRLAVLAVAITLTEWLRGHIFTGFPWLLPGYVWTPGEPVSQLASVIGIYGLSLITLLIAAAPATIADGQVNMGHRFAPFVGAALVVGLIWGWGVQRLDSAPHDLPGAQPIIRVADSGLSQADKWQSNPDQEWRVLQRYQDVSGAADESHASVLIWPEGAIPVVNFFTLENPAFLNAIGAGLGDRALVVGVARREARNGRVAYFNSAAVIDGVSGVPRISQIYDKNHLVPFGEEMPPFLQDLANRFHIAPLQKMGELFTPGPPPTRLVIPDAPPAIVLICYEAIFPGATPRGAERPGWIINISNDAWFGDLNWFTGPWQHFEMARYRAIEEGLPLARAASGGISAIVDPYGRVVRMTRRQGGFAEAQLPSAIKETTLARWGDYLFPLLLIFIAALRLVPAAAVTGLRR